MRNRVRLSMGIAGVAAALLTASCGDSVSPTEPHLAPTPTQSPAIAGGWTGTYSGGLYDCEAPADAAFGENRGEVWGTINVSAPCGNVFLFQGTFEGNTLLGELTDFDGYHFSCRGTVSGGTLEIPIDGGPFGSSRLTFHR